LESMMYRLSDLTRAAYTVDVGASGDATREAALFETAAHIGRENLLWLRGAIAEAHKAIRDVSLPRIWLEAEMIRIATASQPAAKPVQEARREVAAPAPKPPIEQKREAPPAAVVKQAPPQQEVKPEVREMPTTAVAAAETPVTKVEAGSPEAKWKQVVQELGDISKSMGLRLAETRVGSADDAVLIVEFTNNIEYEWVANAPKRKAGVADHVRAVFGPEWKVEFIVNKNGARPVIAEPEAVELPVEGEPLHKLATEILGQNG
jgi:DNA polymerase III gamma/tau subunit